MGAKTTKISQLESCTLWKADRSPSCRAVMMLIDKLNLNVSEVDVNMDKGEQKCPDMIAMNPLQTLPIFKDRHLILRDSHAIMVYLSGRYGGVGENVLMPTDAGARSLVAQAMCYHCGVLHPVYQAAVNPILYRGVKFVIPNVACDIECCYMQLEGMLRETPYITGSVPNVADMTISACISTMDVLKTINHARYPCLSTWLYKMSRESYYVTGNNKGLAEFTNRIDCGPVRDLGPNRVCDEVKFIKDSFRRRHECTLCPCPDNQAQDK